jgi:Prion-inhibition and propagation
MVAVEPVSLTIGAIALASLFSTCIEFFEYFKAGKALEDDVDILLVKLDLEKTRLLIWGNAVGVMKTEKENRAAGLEDPVRVTSLTKCLEKIKTLLSNTEKLENTYGLRKSSDAELRLGNDTGIVSSNSMNIFKPSYRRFWARFAGQRGKPSLVSQTKWAIHDKPKFELLVNHLKDFVDGLNEVIPMSRESQDRIIEEDITSILDISKLRLVHAACEGSYRTWSDMASAVIDATEERTVDRRTLEEILRDDESVVVKDHAQNPNVSTSNGDPKPKGMLNPLMDFDRSD